MASHSTALQDLLVSPSTSMNRFGGESLRTILGLFLKAIDTQKSFITPF